MSNEARTQKRLFELAEKFNKVVDSLNAVVKSTTTLTSVVNVLADSMVKLDARLKVLESVKEDPTLLADAIPARDGVEPV